MKQAVPIRLLDNLKCKSRPLSPSINETGSVVEERRKESTIVVVYGDNHKWRGFGPVQPCLVGDATLRKGTEQEGPSSPWGQAFHLHPR